MWAPANTFFPKFSIKLYYCQERRNFRFISKKNHLHYQKGNKKLHITHYYGYFLTGLGSLVTGLGSGLGLGLGLS